MVQHRPRRKPRPSGLVKGWATEAASQLLYDAGAHHTCVNGGGDLQLHGQPVPSRRWRIGIAHPLQPGKLATVITAHGDLAVATSGTAERGAHILNPHHGTPATTFASLTLIGPRLTVTDTYAVRLRRRRTRLGRNTGRLQSPRGPARRPGMAHPRIPPIWIMRRNMDSTPPARNGSLPITAAACPPKAPHEPNSSLAQH
ncbi:FAD:protein FMN transferase [Streptomyces sp. NPDC051664]|uniref:FAD:protein FMN transferase n=1 Tax=Streptomyces sp. NPDC051664 TaxID=3365668 RepID=UPI0037BB859A